jgi:cell division protein FtsI/penicillin-binding protein 2
LMRPLIIDKVTDPLSQKDIVTQPVMEEQVMSPATAQQVVQMMVHAASKGEAQWTASRTHTVAGKTGTSQIAINGAYDAEKTIASFVGFAPAASPRFIMLVKLTEPTESPWAAETAAPLWYAMAQRLYLLLNIPPDKQVSPTATTTPTASSAATLPAVDPDILHQ